MNIFKEMALSVYNFKDYKEFLKNKKSKVFLFSVVVMLVYFLIKIVAPFLMLNGAGLSSAIRENVPDFKLENGVLQVDEVIQVDDGDICIWIDTNPEEVFFGAEDMAQYYYGYSSVLLMDSEKLLVQSNSSGMQEFYFSEWDGASFSKEDLMDFVPSIYFLIGIVLVICYIVMTALFFFGVLFVALMGMIVASCMKYQLTFGQLYLLGVYSRVLPLLIKALVSFLPFSIPYFWVINFGISVVILGLAIKGMKDSLLQQQNEFGSSGNMTWMQ